MVLPRRSLDFQAKQVLERPVGQVNFLGPVQQQQPLDHGIEQHLLLRLGLHVRLLLAALGQFQLGRAPALLRQVFSTPQMLRPARPGESGLRTANHTAVTQAMTNDE